MTDYDIFLSNKFSKCYYFMIDKIYKLKRDKKDNIYYEKHHIKPRCMGGSNKASNLVYLTPAEHLIMHWLLTKMCQSEQHKAKMLFAFNRLKNSQNKVNSIKDSTYNVKNLSKIYEDARLRHIEMLSSRMKGSGNPMWGRKLSEETLEKMRKSSKKGKIYSDEEHDKIYGSRIGQKRDDSTKKAISNALLGKKKSKEHIINSRNARTYFQHSDAVRAQISKSLQGTPKSQEARSKFSNTMHEKEKQRLIEIECLTTKKIVRIPKSQSFIDFNFKKDGVNKALRLGLSYKGFIVRHAQ